MLYGNTWHTVCDAVFDQQDAEVVCRELDCGAPVQVLGAAAFDKGDAQMWTEEIQCRGEETIIRLCPTSKDIQYLQDNCVGLICSGKMSQFILSVMQSNLTFKSLNIYLNRIVVPPNEHLIMNDNTTTAIKINNHFVPLNYSAMSCLNKF